MIAGNDPLDHGASSVHTDLHGAETQIHGGHALAALLVPHFGIAGPVVGQLPAPQIPTVRAPRRQCPDAVTFDFEQILRTLPLDENPSGKCSKWARKSPLTECVRQVLRNLRGHSSRPYR